MAMECGVPPAIREHCRHGEPRLALPKGGSQTSIAGAPSLRAAIGNRRVQLHAPVGYLDAEALRESGIGEDRVGGSPG